jgi:hypothetical protein
MLDQRLQDLEQEKLGYRIGGGDLRNTAQPVVISGAIHQDAHGVVGLSGKAHSVLSKPWFG